MCIHAHTHTHTPIHAHLLHASQPTLLKVIRTSRHTSMRSCERECVERALVEACLLAPNTTSRPSGRCLVQVRSQL